MRFLLINAPAVAVRVSTAPAAVYITVPIPPVLGSSTDVFANNISPEWIERILNRGLEEYEKGNYVVAGGDFNQTFEPVANSFPLTEDTKKNNKDYYYPKDS